MEQKEMMLEDKEEHVEYISLHEETLYNTGIDDTEDGNPLVYSNHHLDRLRFVVLLYVCLKIRKVAIS